MIYKSSLAINYINPSAIYVQKCSLVLLAFVEYIFQMPNLYLKDKIASIKQYFCVLGYFLKLTKFIIARGIFINVYAKFKGETKCKKWT